MTEHPITPPPELVRQWDKTWNWQISQQVSIQPYADYIATQAASWGADQELEACCEWLDKGPYGLSIAASASDLIGSLRATRRPKPSSLKEQLEDEINNGGIKASPKAAALLARALEVLPE